MSTEDATSIHSIPDLLQAAGKKRSAYLIVLSSGAAANVGQMFKLDKHETVLGRSADADLVIEGEGISRRHAKLVQLPDGGFQLVDLGSTNGVYLNGIRSDFAPLQDGDKLQLGSETILKFSIQDELEEQYQRSIYESATRDGLTRVFNKKYFLDVLRKEFSFCLRHQLPLSVVMIDIDHFKPINDTYGHQAGDYILQRVAAKLEETLRNEDTFARYGGEEFGVVLRESPAEAAHACAERCRKAVAELELSFAGQPIKVTVSLGVATLLDSDFSGPDDLLGAADRYLYRAKNAGRNRVDGRLISGP